jgi:hypothetical protein
MEEKKFTLSDMKAAFRAGVDFCDAYIDYNLGETDDVKKPDFGEWMEENFNVDVEKELS